MTTNPENLSFRLRRIKAALATTQDRELSKFGLEAKGGGLGLDWQGNMSKEDMYNFLWTAIHNTSNLFGHLRVWAGDNEALKKEMEAINKNSRSLRILRTLDNKDKHVKARNKNEALDLVNVQRCLQISSEGEDSGVTIWPDGTVEYEGNVLVVIHADVINTETQEKLGSVSGMLDDALRTWENFMRRHGLLEP